MAKKKLNQSLFTPSPHVGINGNQLLWNVSFEDILEVGNPDNNSWNVQRLRECDQVLFCINAFGTHRLFKLIDLKKLSEYQKAMGELARLKSGKEDDYRYYSMPRVTEDDPQRVLTLFWSLMDVDTTPAKNINIENQTVPISKFFTVERALELRIQKHIVDGLNQFYEQNEIPTRATLGFSSYKFPDNNQPIYGEYGEPIEDPSDRATFLYNQVEASDILTGEVPFDDIIPSFAPDGYTPGKYKFIIDTPYEHTKFTNNIISSAFNRLFVYIPGFDLWQEVSRKNYENLCRLSAGKIKYSKVDDPHCFSTVYYTTEFNMDSIDSILLNAVAIPADIHWHQMFSWQRTNTAENQTYMEDTPSEVGRCYPRPKTYDALTFEFDCYLYNINLTLTQEELGIGNNVYTKKEVTGVNQFYGRYLFNNNDFWLLGIIHQILAMKPSMGDLFSDGDNDG